MFLNFRRRRTIVNKLKHNIISLKNKCSSVEKQKNNYLNLECDYGNPTRPPILLLRLCHLPAPDSAILILIRQHLTAAVCGAKGERLHLVAKLQYCTLKLRLQFSFTQSQGPGSTTSSKCLIYKAIVKNGVENYLILQPKRIICEAFLELATSVNSSFEIIFTTL